MINTNFLVGFEDKKAWMLFLENNTDEYIESYTFNANNTGTLMNENGDEEEYFTWQIGDKNIIIINFESLKDIRIIKFLSKVDNITFNIKVFDKKVGEKPMQREEKYVFVSFLLSNIIEAINEENEKGKIIKTFLNENMFGKITLFLLCLFFYIFIFILSLFIPIISGLLISMLISLSIFVLFSSSISRLFFIIKEFDFYKNLEKDF